MTEFCLKPETILGLLDEISRHRALEPHETDILEDILSIETAPFRWNPRLENQLLVAAQSKGGIARFARRHGASQWAVYQKLCRLRKSQSRKGDLAGVKG